MTRYSVSMNLVCTNVIVEASSREEAIADAQEQLEELQLHDRSEGNLTVAEIPAAAETPA